MKYSANWLKNNSRWADNQYDWRKSPKKKELKVMYAEAPLPTTSK